MYQHLHARLPVEQRKDVPEPVVVLLEALLQKDPAQRFQTPTELSKVMPTITDAINAGRRITRQKFQKTQPVDLRVGTRKARARGNFSSQIDRYRKRCFWAPGQPPCFSITSSISFIN